MTYYFDIPTEGVSMLPLFLPGDRLSVKELKFNKLQVNDLVLIKHKNNFFAHRIIYINKKKQLFVTKGDNNLDADGFFKEKNLWGKVYLVKRGKKKINPEFFYLAQSALYFREIKKICRQLEKNHIAYVFLKGLPVHLYFEGAPPRRIYLDCDLLVDETSYTKTLRIFHQLGYSKLDNDLVIKKINIFFDKPAEAYFKFVGKMPVVFDIHKQVVFGMTQISALNNLYPSRLVKSISADFLKRRVKVFINKQALFILSEVNLALYLALHFFHHNYQGVFRLELLRTVLSKLNDRQLQQLTSLIKHYRLSDFVYPVFVLLSKYFVSPQAHILQKKLLAELVNKNEVFKIIAKANIFNEDKRIVSGIKRFKNLVFLSPLPWWRRLLVFANLKLWLLVLSIFIIKYVKNEKRITRKTS